jgi:hypothetical protein
MHERKYTKLYVKQICDILIGGIRHADHVAPSIRKTNFADNRPSLGRHSSPVDSGHGVFSTPLYKLMK